jgi:hypothetical protein
VKLATHLHLVPRLRTTGAKPLLPLYAFMARTVEKFHTVYITTLSDTSMKFSGTECEVLAMIRREPK